jgi:hypothetical protein
MTGQYLSKKKIITESIETVTIERHNSNNII